MYGRTPGANFFDAYYHIMDTKHLFWSSWIVWF